MMKNVKVTVGNNTYLSNSRFMDLLQKGVYQPTDAKIDRLLQEMISNHGLFFVAADDRGSVGILIAVEMSEQNYEIRNIIVAAESRRMGIGRQLVYELVKSSERPIIKAETDDDAVKFYHSLGFCIRSLGEKYPGVVRYECIYDHGQWKLHSCKEIADQFKKAGVRYWVSGGWATDLYLGRQTRSHDDLDISILRRDQFKLKTVFPGWEIYHTHAPGLRFWNGLEYLDSIPNVWIRESSDMPWSVEVMFQESDGATWKYRRNTSIQKSIEDIGAITANGIAYLSPAIQLLFKGGGTSYQEKDTADLNALLPIMSTEDKVWLCKALRTEFPDGHDWITIIENEDHT